MTELSDLLRGADGDPDRRLSLAAARGRVAARGPDGALQVVVAAARVAAFAEAVSLLAVGVLGDAAAEEARASGAHRADPVGLARSSAAAELAVATPLTPRTAEARLDHAEHVISCLPETWAALAAGDLDAARVWRISDGTAGLTPALARRVEAEVLGRARDQTTTQVTRAVTRARCRVEDRPADAVERVRARCTAYTRPHPEVPGLADLVITGPSPLVAAAFARIDAAARDVVLTGRRDRAATDAAGGSGTVAVTADGCDLGDPTDERLTDPVTLGQARADVALAALAGDEASLGRVDGVAVELAVVAPAATVLGLGDEPGEVTGPVNLGDLPAAMVRELAGDARWRRWFTDDSGTVVGVGRHAYRPSAALADLVRARDRTCRFPRCSRRAQRCDLDHVVPFPAGPTTPGNLVALCRRHHRLKHEAGWSVQGEEAGGDLTWTTPSGREATTAPCRAGETTGRPATRASATPGP